MKVKNLPNGFRVEVNYDPSPENPRTAWDNAGTVVLDKQSRYCFGDEPVSAEDLQELADDQSLLKLPIYLYSHSGISIRTTPFSCYWDSGLLGMIYISKEDAKREFPHLDESEVLDHLKGEVETLDSYLTGEVYGYQVFKDDEEISSCCGFYGDVDDCLSAGVEEAEAISELVELSSEERDLVILGAGYCGNK